MQDKGFTLLELVISITIISILATIAVRAYSHWTKKINIENDTKQIFVLLNEARAKAFAEKRICGVLFNGKEVRLVCDTDMDSSITDEAGSIDKVILKNNFGKSFSYARFDRDGTASIIGTVYATDISTDPNYSCITISLTRIKMGKWDGTTCNLK